MKKVLFLFLIIAVFVTCKSIKEVPPPAFIMWCDTCTQDTSWLIYDDYFKCSLSGTLW